MTLKTTCNYPGDYGTINTYIDLQDQALGGNSACDRYWYLTGAVDRATVDGIPQTVPGYMIYF
jgi:hypothetical protein